MLVYRGVTQGDLVAILKEGKIKATLQKPINMPEQPIICLASNEHDAVVYANRKIVSGEPCLEPKEPVVITLDIPRHLTYEAMFEDDCRKQGYVACADLSTSFIVNTKPVPKLSYEEVRKELKE